MKNPQNGSLLRSVGWLGLANLITKPLWFVFIVFTIRELGSVEFGQYSYLIALCGMVLATFEGGIDIHTIRRLSAHPDRLAAHHAAAVRIKFASFLMSILILIGYAAIGPDDGMRTPHVVWVFVMLASLAMIMHYRSYFRAYDRFRYEAYSIVFEKGIASGFGLIALLAYGGLDAFLPAFATGYLIALALTILLQRRLRRELFPSTDSSQAAESMFRMLLEALPFAFMNLILNYRIRISSVLLQHIGGRSDWVGYYNSGYRLVEAYGLIPSLLTAPLLPEFVKSQENYDRIRDTLITSIRFLLIVSVSVALVISAFGDLLIPAAFGKGYDEAIHTIRVIIWAIVPISVNYVTGSLISGIGRQAHANPYMAAEFVALIIIYWVAISHHGHAGAAWATIITESIYFGVHGFLLRDILPFRQLSIIIVKLFLISACILTGASVLSDLIPSLHSLLIACALIPVLILWVRLITPSELRSMIKQIRNRSTTP